MIAPQKRLREYRCPPDFRHGVLFSKLRTSPVPPIDNLRNERTMTTDKRNNDELTREIERLRARIGELETEEARCRVALYGMGEGTVVVDAEGKVRRVNPVAEVLTGWSEPEADGKPLAEVFRLTADADDLYHRVRSRNAPVDLEHDVVLTARDGNERPIGGNIAPVRDADGNITGAVIVFRDETEIRHARNREHHLKRVLMAIREVDRLITTEKDPLQLIQRACDNLTGTLGYHSAWIIVLNESGDAAAMTAHSGFENFNGLEGGDFSFMEKRFARGEFTTCTKKALARGDLVTVPVTIMEPRTDCPECPLSGEYPDRSGLTRVLSYAGKVHGVLSVSVPSAFARDPEEQRLFSELADDLAFGLHGLAAAARIQRLDFIVNTVPHPMSFVSPDYRYLAVNAVYADLYRVEPEKIVGRTPADFLGVEMFETEIKPRMDRCFAGETVRYEINTDFPAKGRRWMEVNYYPYSDGTGEITGLVYHGFDITERKETETALRESEARLRAAGEVAYDLTYEWNPDDDALLWFGDIDGLLGYEAGEIPRTIEGWLDLILPDDRERLEMAVAHHRGSTDSIHYEYRVRCKDGSYRHWRDRGRPLYDERGRPGRRIGVCKDITEQKRTEEALRESEARYRTHFQEFPIPIFVMKRVNGSFVLTDCNAAAEAITKGGVKKVLGLPAERIYATPEKRHMLRTLDVAFRERRIIRREFDYRFATTGESFHFSGTWVPVGPDTVMLHTEDITERRRAESARRESEEGSRRSSRDHGTRSSSPTGTCGSFRPIPRRARSPVMI